jgi:spoIIIJ-associated protein
MHREVEEQRVSIESEQMAESDTAAEPVDVAGPTSQVRRLEEEGEIAADYLEELLDIADLDGDIDIDVDHGRAAVEIVADEPSERRLRRLVGTDGEVLDALQELTRLAVQAKTGDRSRLMLDVAGHRKARRAELTAVANVAVERVRSTGDPMTLEPMNPFERKVIHDAVAAAGLASDSEGAEPNRRVVIRTS